VIHPGDTIVNPVTGERIVFHKTAASTNGEYVEIEVFVAPGGVVAAAHVHPYQSERFEILGGTIGMKVGRKKLEARYGDVVTVEPGTPHKFWNAGDGELHFVTVVKPALQFEQLLEDLEGRPGDRRWQAFRQVLQLRLLQRSPRCSGRLFTLRHG
jgi:mannose-6-phosphate isomerase-like protein (cupin superfamily)